MKHLMQHETFGATLKHSMKYCHIETNNHHNIETFGVTFGEILQHFSEASLKLQESLSKHCEKADANVTKTKSRMNIMNRTPQHHENYTGDPWCEGPCSAAPATVVAVLEQEEASWAAPATVVAALEQEEA